MRSFTRMVSVWSPSLLYAQSFAPTFIAMLLMFGGYLVPRVRPLSSLFSLTSLVRTSLTAFITRNQ
jgi:hypothetical protein